VSLLSDVSSSAADIAVAAIELTSGTVQLAEHNKLHAPTGSLGFAFKGGSMGVDWAGTDGQIVVFGHLGGNRR
jgi:hypothetical protein